MKDMAGTRRHARRSRPRTLNGGRSTIFGEASRVASPALGVPIQVTERCLNHKSGVRSNPLIQIYQRHDYAAEVKAAFEKWTDHVVMPVDEQLEKEKVAA